MQTTDLAVQNTEHDMAVNPYEEDGLAALVHVLGTGDLSKLSDRGRVGHYLRLCRSLGLNELSRPFDWIFFKEKENEPAKLALYANQSCAAQLRRQHHMRVKITRREQVGDLFCCEATAYTPDGREDTSAKYVPVRGQRRDGSSYQLSGAMLANAYMKAETGAKRRVTLSMIGLASPPDQDEAASWKPAIIDGRGRIVENPTDLDKALAADPGMARAIREPVFEDMEIEDDDPPVSQAARPEELEQPRQEGPRPTLKNDDQTVKRWLGAWFAAVKGTSLDTDDARHRYVASWTQSDLEWPEGKQTSSLETAFRRMTEAEAGDFLAHVRALCEGERRELLEDADQARPAPRRRHPDDKVHAAAVLTGAPADNTEGQAAS